MSPFSGQKKSSVCFQQWQIFVGDFISYIEEKSAFDSIPFVTSQPTDQRDIYISLIEENKRLVTEEHEWENEWNQSGMATRLSKEVKKIMDAIMLSVVFVDIYFFLNPVDIFLGV